MTKVPTSDTGDAPTPPGERKARPPSGEPESRPPAGEAEDRPPSGEAAEATTAERARADRRRARRYRWNRVLVWARHYTRPLILVAIVLLFMAVFGFPRYRDKGDDGPPAGSVPAFEVEYRDEHTLHILTDTTKEESVRYVFDRVRKSERDGDYWDVVVRCASIPEGEGDTRIATGRFANTVAGQNVTGLENDDVDFAMTGRTNCNPVLPTVPGAVNATDVFAGIEAAGLRVISARDGSEACAEIDCAARTLTDQFTVIVWPDEARAADWADLATIDVWRVGPVTTVQLNEGGFDPDGAERQQYAQAIADLAAAHGTPSPATTVDGVGDVVGA